LAKLLASRDLQNKLMLNREWCEQVSQIVHPDEVHLYSIYLAAKGYLLQDVLGEDTEIIKFVVPPGKGTAITAAEKGHFDLLRTKQKLEQDFASVLTQQDRCLEAAKKSLREKQRVQAKYHLRCKNSLEKRADKLQTLISNLTDIMYQIEDAKSDAMVISAYETGKKALEKVLADNNVTVDRATDAMLDLEEALEDQAEISSVLGRQVAAEDESILEDELAELLELENTYKSLEGEERLKEKEKPHLVTPDLSKEIEQLRNLTITGVDTLGDAASTSNRSLSQA